MVTRTPPGGDFGQLSPTPSMVFCAQHGMNSDSSSNTRWTEALSYRKEDLFHRTLVGFATTGGRRLPPFQSTFRCPSVCNIPSPSSEQLPQRGERVSCESFGNGRFQRGDDCETGGHISSENKYQEHCSRGQEHLHSHL